ncbi:MAG: hypothetical protein ACYSUK_09015 [Planctomycetota bacterium]
MAILVLLNNFLHDFSAVGWLFSSVILCFMFHKIIPDSRTDIKIIKILKITLLLMRFSFAGIIIFGIIRVITYKQYEWNQLAGQSQITLLLVKHVILSLAFVFGLVYYFKASNLVRKAGNEKT